MNENFTVYRDGAADSSFARKKRFQAARRAFVREMKYQLKPLKVGIKRAMDEWELHDYDQKHGTHLLREYRAKREAAKLESMRRTYGLV